MKRVLLTLAAISVLWFAVGSASAHDYYWRYRPYVSYYAPVVRAPITVVPRVVVPVRVAARVVYPPVYGYYPYGYYSNYAPSPYYCAPGPSYGFYYQSGGLSLGVGF